MNENIESCQREKRTYDEEGVREAVRLFLKSIGEDPEREGLVETPDRIARACRELFAGLQASPAAGAGAFDPADRRRAGRVCGRTWCDCGDRMRAPVHVDARHQEVFRPHGDLCGARSATQPRHPSRSHELDS